MTDSAIARCTAFVGHFDGSAVLYRHSRTTETFLAKPGESLPRRKGEGVWCPITSDNVDPEKLMPIVIGSGLMWITEGAELKAGDEINIWSNVSPDLMREGVKTQGLYRVTHTQLTRVRAQDAVHIQVEYLGEMDPTKLIHLAGLFNC